MSEDVRIWNYGCKVSREYALSRITFKSKTASFSRLSVSLSNLIPGAVRQCQRTASLSQASGKEAGKI